MQPTSPLDNIKPAYSLEDITIVPSKRTRDPEEVDISWQLDCFEQGLPMMGSAMDSAMSPETVITVGRLGGIGVLNLEGLWTRYEDPTDIFAKIAELSGDECTAFMQQAYLEPIKPQLIADRVEQIAAAGIPCAASLTPARVKKYYGHARDAGLKILVIQATVVSAEHVSRRKKPLNLKKFVRELQAEDLTVVVGNTATYSAAKNLMQTGASAVLVGIGPGEACTSRGVLGIGVPQATAIANAVQAREKYLAETGIYCHVIADGGMSTGGQIAKAIAVGADAVMIGSPLAGTTEAPGLGYHWGMAAPHPDLPRGVRVKVQQRGTIEDVLVGPAHDNDGHTNLFGALRTSMATCGYESVKRFQSAELALAPSIRTEGKALQQAQGVGMWTAA